MKETKSDLKILFIALGIIIFILSCYALKIKGFATASTDPPVSKVQELEEIEDEKFLNQENIPPGNEEQNNSEIQTLEEDDEKEKNNNKEIFESENNKVEFYIRYDGEIARYHGIEEGKYSYESDKYTPKLVQYDIVLDSKVWGATDSKIKTIQCDIEDVKNKSINVNLEIRNLINKKNTNGFFITEFPTDEEIFEKLDTEVNKKQFLEQGEIQPDNLNSNFYEIRWYVFQYDSENTYRIEGVLVKKDSTDTKSIKKASIMKAEQEITQPNSINIYYTLYEKDTNNYNGAIITNRRDIKGNEPSFKGGTYNGYNSPRHYKSSGSLVLCGLNIEEIVISNTRQKSELRGKQYVFDGWKIQKEIDGEMTIIDTFKAYEEIEYKKLSLYYSKVRRHYYIYCYLETYN